MRWIDRGAEPGGVDDYARQHTQGWISYFRDGVGARPSDHRWSEFRASLGELSGSVCWYCERLCEPAAERGKTAATLDHFKPISRFPELAYEWSNWVFSCRECNEDYKANHWPDNGYVDPAAEDMSERPERYFDYDIETHEVIPKDNLHGEQRRRAWETIEDLDLNRLNVRLDRSRLVSRIIDGVRRAPAGARDELARHFANEPGQFLGSTRMALAQLRDAGEIPAGG